MFSGNASSQNGALHFVYLDNIDRCELAQIAQFLVYKHSLLVV